MGFINSKTIIGLPAYTESGTHLGKVSDFEVDVETHSIIRYIIKSGRLSVISKELIVVPAEVMAILPDKMILKDSSVRELASATRPELAT